MEARNMSKQQINLQDLFLNQVRKEGVMITLYLVNGFQLKGVLRGFDNFTVILDSDGKQQMVYKHAISTIMPSRPINLSYDRDFEV
jgi:host factor-I protein